MQTPCPIATLLLIYRFDKTTGKGGGNCLWGDSRLAKHDTHPIGEHLNYWITSENVNGIYFSIVYMVNVVTHTFSCERRGAPTAARPVGDPVLRRGHATPEGQLAGGHQGQPLAPHAQGKYLCKACKF